MSDEKPSVLLVWMSRLVCLILTVFLVTGPAAGNYIDESVHPVLEPGFYQMKRYIYDKGSRSGEDLFNYNGTGVYYFIDTNQFSIIDETTDQVIASYEIPEWNWENNAEIDANEMFYDPLYDYLMKTDTSVDFDKESLKRLVLSPIKSGWEEKKQELHVLYSAGDELWFAEFSYRPDQWCVLSYVNEISRIENPFDTEYLEAFEKDDSGTRYRKDSCFYDYLLTLSGTMPGETVVNPSWYFVVLSNDPQLTFDEVLSGFISSQLQTERRKQKYTVVGMGNVLNQNELADSVQEWITCPNAYPIDDSNEITIGANSVSQFKGVFTIRNHSNFEISYGDASEHEIQVFLNGSWYQLTRKSMDSLLDGYCLQPDMQNNLQYTWLTTYGRLPNGLYRLVEDVVIDGETRYIASPFLIKDSVSTEGNADDHRFDEPEIPKQRILTQTWNQLSAAEANEISGSWENGTVDEITFEQYDSRFYLDEAYYGKVIYMVTFSTKNRDLAGDLIKLVDMESGEIVGYNFRG